MCVCVCVCVSVHLACSHVFFYTYGSTWRRAARLHVCTCARARVHACMYVRVCTRVSRYRGSRVFRKESQIQNFVYVSVRVRMRSSVRIRYTICVRVRMRLSVRSQETMRVLQLSVLSSQ